MTLFFSAAAMGAEGGGTPAGGREAAALGGGRPLPGLGVRAERRRWPGGTATVVKC
jgi:hypothetical protein